MNFIIHEDTVEGAAECEMCAFLVHSQTNNIATYSIWGNVERRKVVA